MCVTRAVFQTMATCPLGRLNVQEKTNPMKDVLGVVMPGGISELDVNAVPTDEQLQ